MRKTIISMLLFILTTTSSYAYVNMLFITAAPQMIQFHIEDSNASITGYTSQGNLYQIQYLLYRTNSISALDESQIGYYDRYNEIRSNSTDAIINNGRYKLVIYGYNTPILTEVNIETLWTELAKTHPNYRGKILIYPNSVWTYEFDIPATPPANQQIVLTKVSTPTDLIKDLTTAGQLGYIGSSEFVSEITQKINKIEKERLEPQKPDDKSDKEKKKDDKPKLTPAQKAKKEYTELLSEITEKYNKPESDEFVKKEAYDVLKEDLEYIINHL